MYSIFIAGAGYLGSKIAQEFKTKKQKVFALTRSLEKAKTFEAQEIQPVIADLTRPETLTNIPPAHFIVLCVAPDESTERAYQRIYVEGISNFLDAIRKNPRPHLVVLISSTSVWKDREGDWIDELVPADPETEKARILLQSENLVLKSGFPAAVLRLSGIYGPERNRLKSLRLGRGPLSEEEGYMNMVHARDIASSMQLFFKSAREGEIYIGSDDEPVLRSEFCVWMEKNARLSLPKVKAGPKVEGKRLSNRKWKALGIKLQYPTFREGYLDILNQEKKEI